MRKSPPLPWAWVPLLVLLSLLLLWSVTHAEAVELEYNTARGNGPSAGEQGHGVSIDGPIRELSWGERGSHPSSPVFLMHRQHQLQQRGMRSNRRIAPLQQQSLHQLSTGVLKNSTGTHPFSINQNKMGRTGLLNGGVLEIRKLFGRINSKKMGDIKEKLNITTSTSHVAQNYDPTTNSNYFIDMRVQQPLSVNQNYEFHLQTPDENLNSLLNRDSVQNEQYDGSSSSSRKGSTAVYQATMGNSPISPTNEDIDIKSKKLMIPSFRENVLEKAISTYYTGNHMPRMEHKTQTSSLIDLLDFELEDKIVPVNTTKILEAIQPVLEDTLEHSNYTEDELLAILADPSALRDTLVNKTTKEHAEGLMVAFRQMNGLSMTQILTNLANIDSEALRIYIADLVTDLRHALTPSWIRRPFSQPERESHKDPSNNHFLPFLRDGTSSQQANSSDGDFQGSSLLASLTQGTIFGLSVSLLALMLTNNYGGYIPGLENAFSNDLSGASSRADYNRMTIADERLFQEPKSKQNPPRLSSPTVIKNGRVIKAHKVNQNRKNPAKPSYRIINTRGVITPVNLKTKIKQPVQSYSRAPSRKEEPSPRAHQSHPSSFKFRQPSPNKIPEKPSRSRESYHDVSKLDIANLFEPQLTRSQENIIEREKIIAKLLRENSKDNDDYGKLRRFENSRESDKSRPASHSYEQIVKYRKWDSEKRGQPYKPPGRHSSMKSRDRYVKSRERDSEREQESHERFDFPLFEMKSHERDFKREREESLELPQFKSIESYKSKNHEEMKWGNSFRNQVNNKKHSEISKQRYPMNPVAHAQQPNQFHDEMISIKLAMNLGLDSNDKIERDNRNTITKPPVIWRTKMIPARGQTRRRFDDNEPQYSSGRGVVLPQQTDFGTRMTTQSKINSRSGLNMQLPHTEFGSRTMNQSPTLEPQDIRWSLQDSTDIVDDPFASPKDLVIWSNEPLDSFWLGNSETNEFEASPSSSESSLSRNGLDKMIVHRRLDSLLNRYKQYTTEYFSQERPGISSPIYQFGESNPFKVVVPAPEKNSDVTERKQDQNQQSKQTRGLRRRRVRKRGQRRQTKQNNDLAKQDQQSHVPVMNTRLPAQHNPVVLAGNRWLADRSTGYHESNAASRSVPGSVQQWPFPTTASPDVRPTSKYADLLRGLL